MTFSTRPLPLLAHRLRQLRKRAGLSQMELGVRAGIDESTASARINQYEKGKHTPDFLTMCNLARVLGVDAAYFYAMDEALGELIALYAPLSADERKMVRDYAVTLSARTGKRGDTPPDGRC